VNKNLKNTIRNVESSSYKLDENLEALQHNFLLRGFSGVGRKIRPNKKAQPQRRQP
jgi:phospholipid/cholesterol/gamma-HCH transport system substrate-binding protein